MLLNNIWITREAKARVDYRRNFLRPEKSLFTILRYEQECGSATRQCGNKRGIDEVGLSLRSHVGAQLVDGGGDLPGNDRGLETPRMLN
jgi:hypothetical protein